MRFWDSSALVPLLAQEPKTEPAQALYLDDPDIVVWWTTAIECALAIARLERDGSLPARLAAESFARLDALSPSWIEVERGEQLRETARRLLRVHPLRAADALQLAAAVMAAERRASTLTFITLDERLRDAAAREGFTIIDL